MNKKELKKLIKESIKEVIAEDYVISEKDTEFEKYQNQRERDKEENRKMANKLGVKIWTAKEIKEEYSKTGEDCNYVPLGLVGKSYYLVSPTYDGTLFGEYIRVSDLKVVKLNE